MRAISLAHWGFHQHFFGELYFGIRFRLRSLLRLRLGLELSHDKFRFRRSLIWLRINNTPSKVKVSLLRFCAKNLLPKPLSLPGVSHWPPPFGNADAPCVANHAPCVFAFFYVFIFIFCFFFKKNQIINAKHEKMSEKSKLAFSLFGTFG